MRDRRGRSPDPKPVGKVLGAFRTEVAPESLLASVQMIWPRAVGERIAAVTDVTDEREGVITVACTSAVWAQELEMMGPRITAKLRGELGDERVRKLRFTTLG